LQDGRLTHRELDGIGRRFDQRGDGSLDILDSGKKAIFVEEAMVDRNIEASA
jgi:hypothetical protein